jgi:DNA-binding NtrC family response regulator
VAPAPARGRGFGLLVADEHRAQMAAQERAVIEGMLAQCGGNQSEAARRLGVSRRTLVKRIEAHGLVRPRKHLPTAAPGTRGGKPG